MRIAALLACVAVTGCANLSAGRFLQAKHPASGVVFAQVVYPNPESCSAELVAMRMTPETRDAAALLACSATSASHLLPSRATLRDRTYAYLFDFEAVNVSECTKAVDRILATEKGRIEIVAPCTAAAVATIATAPVAQRTEPVAATHLAETRPIALRWDGFANLITGTVTLHDGGRSGTIAGVLPGNAGKCSGRYEMTAATSGVWSVACTNNKAASGTFEAYGDNKGSSGRGKDSNGNAVEYTIGARGS
jgi:hypothetical protein